MRQCERAINGQNEVTRRLSTLCDRGLFKHTAESPGSSHACIRACVSEGEVCWSKCYYLRIYIQMHVYVKHMCEWDTNWLDFYGIRYWVFVLQCVVERTCRTLVMREWPHMYVCAYVCIYACAAPIWSEKVTTAWSNNQRRHVQTNKRGMCTCPTRSQMIMTTRDIDDDPWHRCIAFRILTRLHAQVVADRLWLDIYTHDFFVSTTVAFASVHVQACWQMLLSICQWGAHTHISLAWNHFSLAHP